MNNKNKKPILKVRNLTKYFPGVIAIDDISFDIYPGKILALLGENGAGKSTLIKILSGIYQQDKGEIYIDDNLIRLSNPSDAFNKGITVIHQELSLAQDLNVAENIFLGKKPYKTFGRLFKIVDLREMYKQSEKVLKMFNSKISPRTLISSLSQTEKQLLEILKAIKRESRIFLMDEPTAGLDSVEVKSLFEQIKMLKSKNVSIIYVSHILEEVFQIADELLILRDGKKIDTKKVKDISIDQAIKMMIGHEVKTYGIRKKSNSLKEEILSVNNLTTLDNSAKNINLKLFKGEILGLAGLAGSGRSELLRAIYGVKKIASGHLIIDNKKIIFNNSKSACNYGLGMIPRERKSEGIFGTQDIKGNITINSLDKVSNKIGYIREKQEKKVASSIVKEFQIKTPNLSTSIDFLSGGNQQKVIFGRCLLANPKILLCDEPTRGIDIGSKAEVFQTMKDYVKKGGTIIMSSSEIHELLELCDRIIVMFEGKVVKEIKTEDTSKEELLGFVVKGK